MNVYESKGIMYMKISQRESSGLYSTPYEKIDDYIEMTSYFPVVENGCTERILPFGQILSQVHTHGRQEVVCAQY